MSELHSTAHVFFVSFSISNFTNKTTVCNNQCIHRLETVYIMYKQTILTWASALALFMSTDCTSILLACVKYNNSKSDLKSLLLVRHIICSGFHLSAYQWL